MPARQSGAIADAEDVGVDRDGRLAEGDVEHHVRGLAADAGQRFERVAVVRGTLPPCSAMSCRDSAITFLALVR